VMYNSTSVWLYTESVHCCNVSVGFSCQCEEDVGCTLYLLDFKCGSLFTSVLVNLLIENTLLCFVNSF